jgi:hydrogenase maturation protease
MVAPVLLAGIGNVLTGDDALGPYVIKLLEASYEFPEEVTVVDAGTPGMDLIMFLENRECALIVDAVRAKGTPGEVRRYDKSGSSRRGSRPGSA